MVAPYLTDRVCSVCGAVGSADEPRGTCPTCGNALFARGRAAADAAFLVLRSEGTHGTALGRERAAAGRLTRS